MNSREPDNTAIGDEPGTHRCVLLLLGLCAVLFLVDTWSLPLTDPDEARYALVVRHMLRTGDWIVPHVEGRVYMDKPAPYFWLACAGHLLTGDVELGGRLVSAVFAAAAVLVTFAFARLLAGNRAGLVAGVVLATSPGLVIPARLYRMDMPFVALTWAAMWWFWRYEQAAGPARNRRWARWLGFYAFCAAATLMKGPAGVVLPGLVVVGYLLLSGRPRRVLEVLSPVGVAAYVLIASPWYVAMSLRHGRYAYEFFVIHNFMRYAEKALGGHSFPAGYYLGIVLGCMLPWTVYLPGAAMRSFPRRWRDRARDAGLLFGWLAVLVPLVFFMFARTRLAVYVLPVVPPLAVMIAIPVARWVASGAPDRLYAVGATGMRVAVAAVLAVVVGLEAHMGWLDAWIVLPAGGVLAALLLATRALRRARRGAYLGWATAAMVAVVLFAATHTARRACAARSAVSLGRMARAGGDGAYVCYYGSRRHSFALYAGRTHARRFLCDDLEDSRELVGLLRSGRAVWCLVQNRQALELLERQFGAALRVVGEHKRELLVTTGTPRGAAASRRAAASRPTEKASRMRAPAHRGPGRLTLPRRETRPRSWSLGRVGWSTRSARGSARPVP